MKFIKSFFAAVSLSIFFCSEGLCVQITSFTPEQIREMPKGLSLVVLIPVHNAENIEHRSRGGDVPSYTKELVESVNKNAKRCTETGTAKVHTIYRIDGDPEDKERAELASALAGTSPESFTITINELNMGVKETRFRLLGDLRDFANFRRLDPEKVYFMFMDSDDTLHPYACEIMLCGAVALKAKLLTGEFCIQQFDDIFYRNLVDYATPRYLSDFSAAVIVSAGSQISRGLSSFEGRLFGPDGRPPQSYIEEGTVY
ncbi:MAG: glycosyltransferase family 2 protein [Holosporales bacterium]|jgi:hypothetical protein|nr:glycosyltransferase family 2 protein [Holosporales bacterium]